MSKYMPEGWRDQCCNECKIYVGGFGHKQDDGKILCWGCNQRAHDPLWQELRKLERQMMEFKDDAKKQGESK